MVLLLLLALLALGGIVATVAAVRTDGYGPIPDRSGGRGPSADPWISA